MIKNFLQELDYENGYKKAVIDITNYIDKHSASLKFNKMFNHKGLHALLAGIIDNIDTFMNEAEDTEFIVTKDKRVVLEK